MIQTLFRVALTIPILAAGLAAQAPRDLPMLVDATWLAENLDVPELVVVEVDRERTSYDAGRISGAHFLPLDRIAGGSSGAIPEPLQLMIALQSVGVRDGNYVVFYGDPLAAYRAWMTADYLGISDRMAILEGGLEAWIAAGQPLSTERPEPRNGSFTFFPRNDRIVDADWIQARLAEGTITLLDARSRSEYDNIEGVGTGEPGHIPGARHLHWLDLTENGEGEVLLPMEELRSRFQAAGATPDGTVVVYSNTGERASVIYFVSRLLGFETRLFEGSPEFWRSRRLPAVRG